MCSSSAAQDRQHRGLKERLRREMPPEVPGVRYFIEPQRHRQPRDELRRAPTTIEVAVSGPTSRQRQYAL